MRLGRILFIAILLFSGATILAAGSLVQKIINDSLVLSGRAKMMIDLSFQQQLKDDYQQELIAILHDYSSICLSFKDFQDKLLSLKIPTEYKDLHFKLVSSFDEMHDKQSAVKAKNQLIQVEKNYNWLSAALSLLISNNF